MPKLSKEKFDPTGINWGGRTTFTAPVEMYLYYSSSKNIFYFDESDIKKHLPNIGNTYSLFSGCDTKKKAVAIVENLFSRQRKEKRKLSIKIRLPKAMTNNLGLGLFDDLYESHGISISFRRIMEISHGESKIYCECNKHWQPNYSNYHNTETGLIDWTQDAENFLIYIQSELDIMGRQVSSFFNETNQDILLEKIRNNPKLLSQRTK